jgi:SH3-like domain-containing protein
VSKPSPIPTRVPAAVAPNPNLSVSTTGLRWAGTGVIHSGGVPVVVRQVAGINGRDDPQLPDGSPVLVAVGPPVPMAGEQWRAIRALNGIIGWVPTTQLAVDGEAGPAPTYVAAVAPTAPPAPSPTSVPTVARGTIANTGGTGVVLRNSPNDTDRSRAGLMDGAGITVLERAGNDWVRVQAGNGATGWVPARYVNAGP